LTLYLFVDETGSTIQDADREDLLVIGAKNPKDEMDTRRHPRGCVRDMRNRESLVVQTQNHGAKFLGFSFKTEGVGLDST